MKLPTLGFVVTLAVTYVAASDAEEASEQEGFIEKILHSAENFAGHFAEHLADTSYFHTSSKPIVQSDVGDSVHLPCNNYPDRCYLPVDYFLWLGTHNSGAYALKDIDEVNNDAVQSAEFECKYINQDASVTTMLEDGVRLLDIDLCLWKDQQPYLCHAAHNDSSVSFADGYGVLLADLLRETFTFLAANPYQIVVLHLSDNLSNTPAYRVNLKQIEDVVEDVCSKFVPDAKKGDCPIVYVQRDYTKAWPMLKELVQLDDKKAKIKSRVIITNSGGFGPPEGYKTNYISQMFWQSSYYPNQELHHIEEHLHQMCKTPSAIGYEAILEFKYLHCVKELTQKIYNPTFLNRSLFSQQACNLGAVSPQTRLVMIMVDYYKNHWTWMKELQRQLIDINWAKFSELQGLVHERKVVKKKEEL